MADVTALTYRQMALYKFFSSIIFLTIQALYLRSVIHPRWKLKRALLGTDYTLAGLRFILAPPIHTHSVDEQRSEVEAEVVPKVLPAITTRT